MPKYSSFWSRVGAGLIDGLIIGIPVHILLVAAYGNAIWTSTKLIHGPLDFLLTWILPAVYCIGMWIACHATVGKKALGQIIVDADTLQPAQLGQLVGRYVAYIPSVLCFGLGLLWVAFDKRNQGWHDKLAGTVVIDRET